MKSSLEWNITAGRIVREMSNFDIKKYVHSIATAFAAQAEEIEKLQNRVEELERKQDELQRQTTAEDIQRLQQVCGRMSKSIVALERKMSNV